MDTLARDIKQTFRRLAGDRGFTAAALLTISLSVGGTAAVFSIVYAILLRPLPYPEPDQLVRLSEVHPGTHAPIPGTALSGPTYRAWSQSGASFQEIAAFRTADYTVTYADGAQRLRGTHVTPSIFRLLRVSPVMGRFFNETEANDGASPVVVLGHSLWRDRFAGDSAVIGDPLTIDGVSHAIIGVAPPGFAFPTKEVGLPDDRRAITLYTPLAVRPRPGAKVIDYYDAIARLKPGATPIQAELEGTLHARDVDRPLADLVFGEGGPVEVRVRSLVDQITTRVRPALLVLAAGFTLVLLIACANISNLFLSRGSDRMRELAVRSALGASRARVIRQLLTESLVIALLGGALGVLVGWALISAIPGLAPADFPRMDNVRFDARLLMIAAIATVFVGMVSGITPALRGSSVDLAASMRIGEPGSVGGSGGRIRRVLLGVEAALAVVLLVGAALLGRSFVELLRVDAGYDPVNVVTTDVRLSTPAGANARTSELTVSIVERLRGMPGVQHAGAGDMAPFGSIISVFSFRLPGLTGPDGNPMTATSLRSIVTPGYAEALGMRLREGRLFRAEDRASAIRPILVNETFAKTYFTDGLPATGRSFTGMFRNWLGEDTVIEVIGVVGDMLPADLDGQPQSKIFVAEGRGADIGHVTLVVEMSGDPAAAVPILRDVVREIDPGATVERMGLLDAKISTSVAGPRFTTFVLVAFAALALALSTTGLYGILSYDIAMRRRELAVRTALGASRRDLVTMVLRDGLTTTVIGLVIGVVLAAVATRAMASVLFGVTPLDRIAFASGPSLLLAVAGAVCLIAARRATRIAPAEALKAE